MRSDKTVHYYNRTARAYEKRWKAYLEHTHSRFLNRLATCDQDEILDISGGTGMLGEHLVKTGLSFNELVINDPSKEMLAVARGRLGDHPAVTFTRYRTDQLPFGKSRFDRILCLNAFHTYPAQASTLRTFHRILKPGGRLFVLDWNRSGFFRLVNLIIRWWTPEHIDTRSLAEMKQLLFDASFRIHSSESWRWRYWKLFFVEADKTDLRG